MSDSVAAHVRPMQKYKKTARKLPRSGGGNAAETLVRGVKSSENSQKNLLGKKISLLQELRDALHGELVSQKAAQQALSLRKAELERMGELQRIKREETVIEFDAGRRAMETETREEEATLLVELDNVMSRMEMALTDQESSEYKLQTSLHLMREIKEKYTRTFDEASKGIEDFLQLVRSTLSDPFSTEHSLKAFSEV